jgi:hypothetical protein
VLDRTWGAAKAKAAKAKAEEDEPKETAATYALSILSYELQNP